MAMATCARYGFPEPVEDEDDSGLLFTQMPPGQAEEHVLQGGGAHLHLPAEAAVEQGLDERRRGVLRDDAAMVHDRQVVAELLGLVHIVRGHDHGHALM